MIGVEKMKSKIEALVDELNNIPKGIKVTFYQQSKIKGNIFIEGRGKMSGILWLFLSCMWRSNVRKVWFFGI